MTEHPITPPPELVAQWVEYAGLVGINEHQLVHLAAQAARWGADQELEACYQWVTHELNMPGSAICLREDRRPEPPSLKEQALLAIDTAVADGRLSPDVSNVVRRALEQLDD